MTKLWLTYCWKDNETEQVDYVVQALGEQDLEIRYDRAQLIPGQRLWPQIDAAITDPSRCDAWAIYATKASLSSEACLEELTYALDRALRTRERSFPIIGIFPEPLDRSIIPSSIASRLYVDLRDPEWASKVAAGANLVPPGTSTNVSPYVIQEHKGGDGLILEIRPRAGRWYPFLVVVPVAERDLLKSVTHGPSGSPPGGCMVSRSDVTMGQNEKETHKGVQISHAIDHLNSAYIYLSHAPSNLIFGPAKGEKYQVRLQAT